MYAIRNPACHGQQNSVFAVWPPWCKSAGFGVLSGCCCEQGHEHSFNVTNVEYTEFDRLGIKDEGESETGISLFPANTNVLYIGLQVS